MQQNNKKEINYIVERDFSAAMRRAAETEEQYCGMAVESAHYSGDMTAVSFADCKFSSCRLSDAEFCRAGFTDCIFVSCDFSNCDFTDAYFNRCVFENCKGMGAKFFGSVLYSSRFDGCNLSFAAFSKAKLDSVVFCGCRMSDGAVGECKLKEVKFSDCDFCGCSFFGTKLAGMDLRENSISGIILSDSLFELRGAVISGEQAELVAKMLGIKVKD